MKYAFVNGVILDGTQDMEPQSGKIILVDGEKITAIVDAGADTSGYEKIDRSEEHTSELQSPG